MIAPAPRAPATAPRVRSTAATRASLAIDASDPPNPGAFPERHCLFSAPYASGIGATMANAAGASSALHQRRASFDKLRMREIESGNGIMVPKHRDDATKIGPHMTIAAPRM